jgi:hypothetical protein
VKIYKVVIGGIEHTLQYSDEEAEARGLKPVVEKAAPAPANKARTAPNKKG